MEIRAVEIQASRGEEVRRDVFHPVNTTTGHVNIKISEFLDSARYCDIRLVETTLYCPFLYTYGDFNSSIQILNTGSNSISYKVTFRNNAGTVLYTTASTALPAHASVNLDARSYIPANRAGSVEIAHTGSPEQIAANMTTLSVSTGLSFDGPFIKRQPW